MLNDLERLIGAMITGGIRYPEAQREFERRFLEAALRASDGSITRAAELTGLHRNTLTRKMAVYERDTAASNGHGTQKRRRALKR